MFRPVLLFYRRLSMNIRFNFYIMIIFAAAIGLFVSCSPAASSSSGGSSNTAGASGSASVTITTNGGQAVTYSANGAGSFGIDSFMNSYDVQVANSASSLASYDNDFYLTIPVTNRLGTNAVNGGVPVNFEYFIDQDHYFELTVGSVILTSIAASSGQHTTGTFSGIGVYWIQSGETLSSVCTCTITNGSFDEIR